MALMDRLAAKLSRTRDRPVEDRPIPTGRQSVASVGGAKTLSPFRSRTASVLETLRRIPEEAEALEFLRGNNADVSMAVWNFIRLANQGHEMHFYDPKDKTKRVLDVETRWKEFASRVNEISNAGLDGLIDIEHYLAYMRGAQAVEVEVNKTRTDIIDVHPIIPQTVTWEYEERNGRKAWIPYQHQWAGKKISLEKGKANFFWVPTDPLADDPRGTLVMAPVLQAIDFQMQILQDLQAVLHHQGWPKNDIKISMERVMNNMPPQIAAAGPEKRDEWLDAQWQNVVNMLNQMEPDSDYIHYDDIEINMNQGANAGRSLDVRAINELVDVQTLSGAKQMAIFMNRNQGVTESWGTVQFRIFCSGIASVQRGSKRLIEEVARLWLRVKGIQASPRFSHNMIDWNSEEQRMTVKLMEQQFWAIAQLMRWVDKDTAAQEVVDAERAVGEPSENIRVSLSYGGGNGERESNKTAQKATGRAGSRIEPQEDA
jgi:hypothetical protein